jgi:hypothetical protein
MDSRSKKNSTYMNMAQRNTNIWQRIDENLLALSPEEKKELLETIIQDATTRIEGVQEEIDAELEEANEDNDETEE